MIIFGSRGDVLDLGDAGVRQCQTCDCERSFRLFLQYRYAHLYFLFGAVTTKRYLMLCTSCQRGWELDAGKVKAALPAVPIPFMHRFGMLVLVSGVALAIGLSAAFN